MSQFIILQDGQTPLMNAVVQVAGLHDGPKALRPGWIDERRKLVEHLVEKQKADMEVKDNVKLAQ